MTPSFANIGLGATELLIIIAIGGVLLTLSAIPAVLAYLVLSRIPPAHQKQQPLLAFLLLIPVFSVVWAFFVPPRVAASLRSYYDSIGDNSVGDCGASLALWLCICSAVALVPLLGIIAGVAALVLLIVFYVKAFELCGRIPRGA